MATQELRRTIKLGPVDETIDIRPPDLTILEEAASIIDGDREQTYGSPRKNLDAIAAYWSAHLKARGLLQPGPNLNFEDVALMMALLKMARLANNTEHRDSQIDAAGYLALMAKCQKDLKRCD